VTYHNKQINLAGGALRNYNLQLKKGDYDSAIFTLLESEDSCPLEFGISAGFKLQRIGSSTHQDENSIRGLNSNLSPEYANPTTYSAIITTRSFTTV